MTSPSKHAGSPARSAEGAAVPSSPVAASLIEDDISLGNVPSDPVNRPATTNVDATPSDVLLDPAITGDIHDAADPAVHETSDAQALAFEDSAEALATLASLSAHDSAQGGLKRRMSRSPEQREEPPIKYARRDEPSLRQSTSPERRNDTNDQQQQQQREPQSTSDTMLRSPIMAMPVHYQHISPAMVAHAHLQSDHNPYASSASAMFQSGVTAQLAQVHSPDGSHPAGAPYFPTYPNSAVSYDSPYSNQQNNNWNMQGYSSNMPSNGAGLGLSESGRPHLDRGVSHEESMRMGGSMDMAGVPGGPGLMSAGIGGSGYGGESSIRGNGISEAAFDLYNPQDQGVHDLNASDSLLNLHSGGMYPGSLANAHHNQDLRSATLQSPSMPMGHQMDQHPGSGEDDGMIPMLGGANAKARDEKQRKRIIQACEPCRIRKAKCNGLQPCGRCGQRGLECLYATERRMRGPNKVKKSQTEKEQANRERQQRKAAERHAQDVAAAAAAIQAVSNPHHHMHPHHQHSNMIDDDIHIPPSAGPVDGMRPPFSPSARSPGIKGDEAERSLLQAYDASNSDPNSASLTQHGQLLSNWPGSGFNMGPAHYMEGMSTSSSRDYDRSDRTTDQRMFYGNHPPTPGSAGAGGQVDFGGGPYQGLGGYATGPAVSASPPNPPPGSSYPREYYAQGKTHRSPLISGERELDYGAMEEGAAAAATTATYGTSISTRFADINMTNHVPTAGHVRTGSNHAELANVSAIRVAAELARDSHLRSSAGGGSGMETPLEGSAAGRATSIAGLLLGELAPEEQEPDQDAPNFPEE